jgi:hypothetical protein
MITLSIIVGIVMVAGGACIYSDMEKEYQFKK